MSQKQFNIGVWDNLDLIFPEGGTFLDGVWYNNEEIKYLNLPLIQTTVMKPIRDTLETQASIVWYDNGNMDRVTTYNVYPPYMVDNIPVLNVYGQKIYNMLIQQLTTQQEEDFVNDFESAYSSL